ncbi:MAG TPA: hypothetical protein VEG63_06040 [Candidatus Acidoferrales bacterium]|nr:hypothetical protein [Candidatus Acidoferrales bacterium]
MPTRFLRPCTSAGFRQGFCAVALGVWLLAAPASRAQLSPQEIRSPELRELQQTYLNQLKALNRSIGLTKFPFPFTLARYVASDPASPSGQDTRGIEFVRFRGRLVLKITGRYNAALSSELLTKNERAARVFSDVFAPILRLVRQDIPADVACDAVGLEIGYHSIGKSKSYEYEGKEILVGVFTRADAFALAAAESDAARQEILNRSDIYLDGQEFGLALGQREPLSLEALDHAAGDASPSRPASAGTASPATSAASLPSPRVLPGPSAPDAPALVLPGTTASRPELAAPSARPALSSDALPAATQQDVARLQAKYQSELDALAKEGLLKFHFVDYAPPSFVLFQERVALQLTLRNPARFDLEHTSIYRRAAQSFDLFLAPQLKDLLSRISKDVEFPALDITVLTQFQPQSTASPEAIEYVCFLRELREFADARITSQDAINQCAVLVNGVRISLNLQTAE